MNPATIEAV